MIMLYTNQINKIDVSVNTGVTKSQSPELRVYPATKTMKVNNSGIIQTPMVILIVVNNIYLSSWEWKCHNIHKQFQTIRLG